MEFSVKKRINRILENVQRVQELAGLSDPEVGYTAPAAAYEDNYEGLQKRFGNNILTKLEMFAESKLNEQLVFQKLDGEDIILKVSPPIYNHSNPKALSINSNEIFIRFGGYMHDAKNYAFNIGYKDKLGEDIFAFRFTMDINGNMNNWQSLNF